MQDERSPLKPAVEELNDVQKAEIEQRELHQTHKARGSLGTYYQMFEGERRKLRFFEEPSGPERSRSR